MIDHEGKTFYVEFKKVDGYTYNMSQFEPAQIRFFEMAMVRNVESYVIIYSQKTKTYWVGEYQYLKWTQNKDG
jgi:penicillin-binding protein-related factor A (putative recombinase)